jgi:hypothetical protein
VMGAALLALVVVASLARSIYLRLTEAELTKAMKELESLGFVPHHILDVGANEGNWADEARDNWAQGAPFFQIEANQALEHFLKEKGNPYIIAIVGDEEKTVTFHKLCDGGACSGGSSVFQENTIHGPGMIKQVRQMTTIDTILKDAKCVHNALLLSFHAAPRHQHAGRITEAPQSLRRRLCCYRVRLTTVCVVWPLTCAGRRRSIC